MNNTRVLICALFALLVAALVYFYVNSTSANLADEPSLEELNEKYAQILLQKDIETPVSLNTPIYNAPLPKTEPDIIKQLTAEEEKKQTEAEIKRQADEIEQKMMAEEKAKIDAELLGNQPPPLSDARVQLLAQALVMATVNHYDEPSGITLLDLKRPDNVVRGMILGIRRNNGIIGRVKIGRLQNGQAFADPIPASFFGKPVDVKVGDELIVIP